MTEEKNLVEEHLKQSQKSLSRKIVDFCEEYESIERAELLKRRVDWNTKSNLSHTELSLIDFRKENISTETYLFRRLFHTVYIGRGACGASYRIIDSTLFKATDQEINKWTDNLRRLTEGNPVEFYAPFGLEYYLRDNVDHKGFLKSILSLEIKDACDRQYEEFSRIGGVDFENSFVVDLDKFLKKGDKKIFM